MNKDIGYLLLFLIVFFIMWNSQGGRLGRSGIIMSPRGDSTIKTSSENSETARGTSGTAASDTGKNLVKIIVDNIDPTDAAKEYVRLRADQNNKEPINITGWLIENKNNERLTIGAGARLPYSAQTNKQENITLAPGEEAIVVTGKSPIGTSFRLNLCTGYFNQHQTFTPSLPQDCPAVNKTPGLYDLTEDSCISLVEKQSRCRVPTVSNYLSDACSGFISKHLSYGGCVEDYKNDKDFSSARKWYVYLGRDSEFWPGTRGTIKLFDRNGNLVTETTY